MTRHSGSILALALLAVAAMTGPSAAEDPTPPVTPPAISPPQVIVPPDQCGGDLKITQATPLQFGVISVQHGAGGVVIVSPSGAVATLGGVAVGAERRPGDDPGMWRRGRRVPDAGRADAARASHGRRRRAPEPGS